MSIALFFFTQIYRLHMSDYISSSTFWTAASVLLFYVFSIVYGRLYTAMHSFTDCLFGVLLGTALWAMHIWCGDYVSAWLHGSGWIGKSRVPMYILAFSCLLQILLLVPAILIPLCLLLVHRHPQPVDDCPCFEDAIAFMSVVLGVFLTEWCMARYLAQDFFSKAMAGNPFHGNWSDLSLWWSIAGAKMVVGTFCPIFDFLSPNIKFMFSRVGILAIFAWRIFAKFLLHRILPPIFRFLSHLVTLPNRRFYTPATDYKNVAPEKGLHPIPSVIDLPGMVEMEVDGVPVGMSTGHNRRKGGKDIKLRGIARSTSTRGEKSLERREGLGLGIEEMGGKQNDVVKHYDADGKCSNLVFIFGQNLIHVL